MRAQERLERNFVRSGLIWVRLHGWVDEVRTCVEGGEFPVSRLVVVERCRFRHPATGGSRLDRL
ncbi:hypothetical protein KS4_24510 [Poriferisphaera corsica]|uniref:Uncharacterized protein n=1 Tax=Poriferisphaera corsica TaxID=2528020 RepID=A0A517YVY6_9BACT|nr:hypothetical protein KS4_24510 [Poriferisphaera corsica]